MMRVLGMAFVAVVVLALGREEPTPPGTAAPREGRIDMARSDDPLWAAFSTRELLARRAESGQPWLPFLDVSTLNVGLYALPAGGEDGQKPHDLDEVYYVLSGRATLSIEGEQQRVEPGSVVYVRAHASHRFHSIEEDLSVLVFFSAKERP